MTHPPAPETDARDPLGWIAAITAGFCIVAALGLDLIDKPYFDEIHYLPSARQWLEGTGFRNAEHPLLAKQIMGMFIAVLGDNPWGWRAGSVVFAGITLFAAMRTIWLLTLSRFAALATGILVATNFMVLVQARIAMLDSYMLGFAMLGCWAAAAAFRGPTGRHWRLALSGVLFGLSLACKWNVAPLPAYLGIAFFIARFAALRNRRGSLMTARDAAPIHGMSLMKAGLWIGVVPLVVYLLHFLTLSLLDPVPPAYGDPIQWQVHMLTLQESVTEAHGYMSRWWQWAANIRPIWYFYEIHKGAQRGVLLLGNPLTSLCGLAALFACLWMYFREKRGDALIVVGAWAATFGIWIIAPKPVQFYYHYLLPGVFLMMALAIVLDRYVWRTRARPWAITFLAASAALMAYFLPILTGQALASRISFADYTWLASWR